MRSMIEIHLLNSMCPIHPAFEVLNFQQYYPDNITVYC